MSYINCLYKFSKMSLQRLSECHSDLQILFNQVIKYRDCSILCGYRNEKDQNDAFNNGLSKVKFPNSKHNKTPLSEAVDVMPYPIDWNDIKGVKEFGRLVISIAEDLYEEGIIKHKIRWGGDWNMDGIENEKFVDLPHYEIV